MFVKKIKCLFICLLVFVVLSSCGRNPDYLYQVTETQLAYNQQHSIKEMASPSADILWIIDNSGSMEAYQQSVIQNMNIFIQEFNKAAKNGDWKMGLLSTDEFDQPYIGFTPTTLLDSNSPDPITIFNNAVRKLGTSGSGTEKAFTPIQNAFTRFPNFFRSDSKLFLIIVSDELEQSIVSVSNFVQFLSLKKGGIHNVITYGIHEMPDKSCGSNDFIGERYEALVKATSGVAYPICDPDFGRVLGAIGANIGKQISHPKIVLGTRPLLSSLKVIYKGNELPFGLKSEGGIWFYDYEDNAIVFYDLNFAISDNESVRVVYEYAQ